MREIDFAYLPIIGRGEQIHIICSMHDIKLNMLYSTPMGDDFQLEADSIWNCSLDEGQVKWVGVE